jgi:hypothetical protein
MGHMTRGPGGIWMLTQFSSQAIYFEQVPQPRPTWKVIPGLRSACGSLGIRKVTVGSTMWAVCAACVFVVLHRRMLAVVVGDAVIGADVDCLHSLMVDGVEHLPGVGPRASIGFSWQQGGDQGIDCLGGGVAGLVGAHPLEIHEQQLTQDDIRRGRAFVRVYGVRPGRHSTIDRIWNVVREWNVTRRRRGRLFWGEEVILQPLIHTNKAGDNFVFRIGYFSYVVVT